MSKMFFYTQDYENYGTPAEPYWKAKGGSDYIIYADVWTKEMIQRVVDAIEYKSDMFESFLIGYQEVHDKFITDEEQFQLEYEGNIEFPAKRLTYDQFLMEYTCYV